MRLDSDSLQTPWQFRGVQLITAFHKRIMLLLMKIRVKASSHIDDTTRHDTTACDTTGKKTKARRFFSLVPHIPRHDHATGLIYYKLYGSFVMYSQLPTFSQEDNGSADEDWSKKG